MDKLQLKDKTWAVFSTLEMSVCLLRTRVAIKQNGLA